MAYRATYLIGFSIVKNYRLVDVASTHVETRNYWPDDEEVWAAIESWAKENLNFDIEPEDVRVLAYTRIPRRFLKKEEPEAEKKED